MCPALHLPVQSGSDSQLERMRRGYAIGEYRDLVSRLRDAVPELALTTDIIVGFCGETDEDFQSTVRLMEDIRFDSAFMFKYSERTGTVAHRKIPDDVPEDTKGSRLRRIIELQEGIALEVNQRWVSHTVEVLVEGVSKRKTEAGKPNWFGRSLHGKVVVFPPIHSTGENACGTPDSGARVTETSSRHVPCAGTNSVVQVEVHRATSHTLYGNAVTS